MSTQATGVTKTPSEISPVVRPGRRWPTRIVAAALVLASLLWVAAANGFGIGTVSAMLPLLATVAIYGTAAVGLNLQFGYGGLLNFGFVAFMAVGAYTTILLIPHLQGAASTKSNGLLPLGVAVVVGIVAAAVLGSIFAIPAIRLRTDYLAIVMIALAEVLRIVLNNVDAIGGGVYGMLGYTSALQKLRPGIVDDVANALDTQGSQLWLAIVGWAGLLLVIGFAAYLTRSPWGKLLRAVRDDELAVRSLGKNPTVIKSQVLMLGGGIGGFAGVLLAFQLSQINPDVFLPQVTFFVFAIVILGGTATTWGPVVGAVIFWIVLTQSGDLVASIASANSSAVSAIRYVIVGVVIVAIIVFRPQGILGAKENVVLELK